MLKRRLIPVLIIRDSQVVQSIQFKHTNVIHYDPIHAIECFNKWAVDEIVMLNVSKSPESCNSFLDILEHISKECFVPLTVGGWIKSIDYATKVLHSGADKIVVNTVIKDDPVLVKELSEKFGKQCIVASVDIKKQEDGEAVVMIDRGARSTGVDTLTWVLYAQELGAGEIFLNSIDHDGFRKGYAIEWIKKVVNAVHIPVIAMGGVMTWDHLVDGINAGADAVAAANIFHYTEQSTKRAKKALVKAGIPIRK